jgi:ankyrin repeat protein
MFQALKRLLSGKSQTTRRRHMIEACPDCDAQHGALHDLFCTKERCPFCGGQLISCECIHTILNLADDKQQAWDEYLDDSVPPLSDILTRWRNALAQQGRIPFESYPDDPIRAACRGDLTAVQRFVENGCSPNAGNEVGYTLLMGAARGESLEVIQFLLSHGAQATHPDKRGYTALHWVVAQPVSNASRQIACLRALINAGANPNAANEEGITPLMNAARFGCRDAACELLGCGADPSLRDNKDKSAKDLASERGHQDVEEILK